MKKFKLFTFLFCVVISISSISCYEDLTANKDDILEDIETSECMEGDCGDEFNLMRNLGSNSVSILPVFVVPNDQTHLVPDPYAPSFALDGSRLGAYNQKVSLRTKIYDPISKKTTTSYTDTYYGTYSKFFNRAKKNLSALLQTTQLKYSQMIKDSTGLDQGTFSLSTWNHKKFTAETFNRNKNANIEPYVMVSRYDWATMHDQLTVRPVTYDTTSEILEELGYSKSDCPFVFVTIFVSDPRPGNVTGPGGGGRPFEVGFDSGGYIQFSYKGVRNWHIPGAHGLSTLIHEVGHSFGMPHVNAYLTSEENKTYSSEACENIPEPTGEFLLKCGNSIMSYNINNWIEGCVSHSAPEGTSNGKENNYYCIFENTSSYRRATDKLPGQLNPENIWQLAKHDSAFPNLTYSDNYYPGHDTRKNNGLGDMPLPDLSVEYTDEKYLFQTKRGEKTEYRPRWSRSKANAHCKAEFNSGNKLINCRYDDHYDMGYKLYWDYKLVGYEPGWSLGQALNNCQWNKTKYLDKYIKCKFDGLQLGYELFLDSKPVGFEPRWSKQSAINNCQWNKTKYPDKNVQCRFEGKQLGYELFWNRKRVGFEPGWSKQSAIDNCQRNKTKYTDKYVQCKFEGKLLGYELFWNGKRVGFEPSWSKKRAIDNCKWNKEKYLNKVVKCRYDGVELFEAR